MARSWVLSFVFSFVYFICGYSTQQDSLQMVHIVYRHGDRSPVGTFPNNPLPESAWPQGYGQLSLHGMIQHYELGKYFRQRYIEGRPYSLLNSSYSRHELSIRSTDYDRTLMSAYSNLAGLYPPSGGQIWNKDLLWQPIPVHTVPQNEDYLLNTDVDCPKYNEYLQAALNSDDIKTEERENKEFYAEVAKLAGTAAENLTTAWDVYDPIFCARCHGLKEPDWVNTTWKGETYFQKLATIQSLEFDVQFNRPGESRFRGGPLLGEMISNMKRKTDGSDKFKAHIYSAHDSTVSAILSAMKVFNKISPPYTATVLVELHKINEKHVVRIFYKNSSDHDPFPLQVPGCEVDCPYDDFVRITKDNVPVDWRSECRNKYMPRTDGLIMLAVGIILVSALIVTVLIFSVIRRQSRRKGYVAYGGLDQKDETF